MSFTEPLCLIGVKFTSIPSGSSLKEDWVSVCKFPPRIHPAKPKVKNDTFYIKLQRDSNMPIWKKKKKSNFSEKIFFPSMAHCFFARAVFRGAVHRASKEMPYSEKKNSDEKYFFQKKNYFYFFVISWKIKWSIFFILLFSIWKRLKMQPPQYSAIFSSSSDAFFPAKITLSC